MMNLIYLHGFQSSPMSLKGQVLKHAVEHSHDITIHLPNLNFPPLMVIEQLSHLIQGLNQVALVGSSLGGFYATQLSATYKVPAVLINPVVRPWQLFMELFGAEQLPYRVSDTWILDQQQLLDLVNIVQPFAQDFDKLLVLLKQGDEVLDYCEAERYYKQSLLISESGGNHAMDDFQSKIPMALRFLSDSIK